MRIAVTGGDGFIGRAVIETAKASDHKAWSFDRNSGNDILRSLAGLEGAEAVVHLAGVLGTHELFSDPERAVTVNTIGSLRIMQWCIEHGARYVGITMPDIFPSIYTATKVGSLRLAQALSHSRGLDAIHVQAWNVYGPGQAYGPGHPQKIIPTFSYHAWHGKPIPVWGDGKQTVDLVHVDDVARILVACATLKSVSPNTIVDAGCRRGHTVLSVAQKIAHHTKSKAGILLLPMRDGEEPTDLCSSGYGHELLRRAGISLPEFSWERLLETVGTYRNYNIEKART